MPPDVEEEVSRAIIRLMMEEPFYAHLLCNLTREISDRVETCSIEIKNRQPKLTVNPRFFVEGLTQVEERIAVLKHLILHLAFRHLLREQPGWEKELADLASDLVVNQYLAPWPLPEGAVTLRDFYHLDLEPEQTLDYYYGKLAQAKAHGDSQTKRILKRYAGKETEDDQGQGQGEDQGVWRDDHSGWSDEPGTEVYTRQIEDMLLRAKERTPHQHWGNLPGPIKEMIAAILERRQPQVDWKRSLRLFANNSRRTRITSTVRRHSKRYGDPNPGIKVKRYQRMAVVIDTSGSVDDESLSAFFSEIHGMWRNGAEIIVIECDAEVQRTYSYVGKIPEGVAGRGGTAFDPAFEHLWERRKREILDGCIYLTDGWAETPEVKPPCKLLWVLTPDSTDEYLRFGSSVKLDY